MDTKRYNTKFILFEIIVIMIGVIGITFAASYIMKNINVNVDTATLAVDYTGSLTLPTVDLLPIEDSSVDTNTDNVMRINFTVKGASSNPNIPIIYDVILSDLEIDKELKNEYLKWELEKNGTVISSGSFDPWFDTIRDGKLWLTEIQQDLPTNSQSADSYEFKLWISESCIGDITTCTEGMDQSNMLGKKLSGKIETVLYTKGKEALVRVPANYATDYITSLLDSNPDTMNNDDPDGNVRYMGKDPNNYVKFNNELWRIIGVFDVASTYGGATEKRLKIIRDEFLEKMAWDIDTNDWSKASLQTYLNGDYYNSMVPEAQELIGDTYWHLGGYSTADISSSLFYEYERGTIVYSGWPTYWVGRIGLLYPSDYGYATSGGQITNRSSCLSAKLGEWYASSYNDCKMNNYLYRSDLSFWTITHRSRDSYYSFYQGDDGRISHNPSDYSGNAVFPVLYLKPTVQITGGDGTSSNPYILGL